VARAYDGLVIRAEFFTDLPSQTLQQVRAAYGQRSVEKGSFFFREQEAAEHLYLLAAGRVKMCQLAEDGQQVTMRVIVPGQLFGGMAVLGGKASYPVSAEAMEASTALSWKGELLRDLARRDPSLGLKMTELMYSHLQELQARFRELATERVERRVARALLRLASQAGRRLPEGLLIDLPLSRQGIAEMTGTTLFTVSRLLSEWERRGMIEAGRERVVIRNPHDLLLIAEDVQKES
jgi:CRP/FNR family transcriptional regulator, nitrogen oxide reductase regulator